MKKNLLTLLIGLCSLISISQDGLRISQGFTSKTNSDFQVFDGLNESVWVTSHDGIGEACSAILFDSNGGKLQSFEFAGKKVFPGESFIRFVQDAGSLFLMTALIEEKGSHLVVNLRTLNEDGSVSEPTSIWDTHGSSKLNTQVDRIFRYDVSPDGKNHILSGLNWGENFAVFDEHFKMRYEGNVKLGLYDRMADIAVANNGDAALVTIVGASKGLESGVRNVKVLYVTNGGGSPYKEIMSPLSGGNLGEQTICFDSKGLVHHVGFTYSGSTAYVLSKMAIASYNPKTSETIKKEFNVESKPVFAFSLVPNRPALKVFTSDSGHLLIVGGSSPGLLKAEISVMDIDVTTWKYEVKTLTTSPYVPSQSPLENYVLNGQTVQAYQICDDVILNEVKNATEVKAKAGKGDKMHLVKSEYTSGDSVKKTVSTETIPGGVEFVTSSLFRAKNGRYYQIGSQGKSKVLISWK